MRNRTFANDQHANAYLSGSVIRIDEKPVYITEVRSGLIYYVPVELAQISKRADNVPLAHPSVDMMPVPLGFLSTLHEKHFANGFLARAPYRQWKQGLTTHNTRCTNPFKYGSSSWPTTGHIIYTDQMRDTILGVYLDPKAAQALSQKKKATVGFSRNFGVFDQHLLFQDFNEPVGEVLNGKPKLHEDFYYLNTQLKADLNASGNC